jgi:hypothetical protein
MIYSIEGYWKNDKSTFEGYLVSSEDYTEDMPDHIDDHIFFYGLGESVIEAAIKDGENTIFDFVITSYEKIN